MTSTTVTAIMRYSRLRVSLLQRSMLQNELAAFMRRGGRVQVRRLETGVLSNVYYGLTLNGPSDAVEHVVKFIDNLN